MRRKPAFPAVQMLPWLSRSAGHHFKPLDVSLLSWPTTDWCRFSIITPAVQAKAKRPVQGHSWSVGNRGSRGWLACVHKHHLVLQLPPPATAQRAARAAKLGWEAKNSRAPCLFTLLANIRSIPTLPGRGCGEMGALHTARTWKLLEVFLKGSLVTRDPVQKKIWEQWKSEFRRHIPGVSTISSINVCISKRDEGQCSRDVASHPPRGLWARKGQVAVESSSVCRPTPELRLLGDARSGKGKVQKRHDAPIYICRAQSRT